MGKSTIHVVTCVPPAARSQSKLGFRTPTCPSNPPMWFALWNSRVLFFSWPNLCPFLNPSLLGLLLPQSFLNPGSSQHRQVMLVDFWKYSLLDFGNCVGSGLLEVLQLDPHIFQTWPWEQNMKFLTQFQVVCFLMFLSKCRLDWNQPIENTSF